MAHFGRQDASRDASTDASTDASRDAPHDVVYHGFSSWCNSSWICFGPPDWTECGGHKIRWTPLVEAGEILVRDVRDILEFRKLLQSRGVDRPECSNEEPFRACQVAEMRRRLLTAAVAAWPQRPERSRRGALF